MPTRRISRIALAVAALAVLPPAGLARPSVGPEPASTAARDTVPTPTPAPFALSDTDGQELVLERLDVRTAVHGMLALTEVELRFRNPRPRRMEGRFSAVLPEGATVSRFAKEVNGRLMEGEVVERMRAQQVYDEILHQMRDPAILDQESGNRFSARVFPIEANGEARLVLAYSQLLRQVGGERSWTLPLRGLPRVGLFTFHGSFRALPGETLREETFVRTAGPGRVRDAGGARVIERSNESFVPAEDLQVAWRGEAGAGTRVLSAGGFYLASFRPALAPAASTAGPRRWLFYLDTSASGADGAAHRIRAIEALLAALPPTDVVDVRAFDHRVTRLASGTARDVAGRVGGALRARRYLGGTDLGAVLRDAATAARGRAGMTVVVQTDGVATMGTVEEARLRAAADSLPAVAVHALVLGARQDAATLRILTGGRGRVVTVPFTDSLGARARDAARRLALPPGAVFSVADAGAEWVHATGAGDVLPGDEVLVAARLKPGARPSPRLAGRGGTMVAAEAVSLPAESFAPLLEREAYRAYIQELQDRAGRATDDSTRRALADEMVRVSVEHRVLSPRTTLLVLETEEDYRRFGLDRRALAEILAVGDEGIVRLDRDTAALPARADASPAREQAPSSASADTAGGNLLRAGESPRNLQGIVATGARAVRTRDEAGDGAEAEEGDEAGDEGEEEAEGSPPPPPPPPAPLPPPPPPPPAAPSMPLPPPPAARVDGAPPAPREVQRPSETLNLEGVVAAPRTSSRPTAPEWTRPPAVTRARVDSLRAALTANPLDRVVRNRLADALWARAEWRELRELALEWQPYDPENPHVYEALGEAGVNLGLRDEAERALGSLVEMADGRPELLQRAGLLLLRVNAAALAETPLRRALERRPDRLNGYRHLALMLWQAGRHEEAAEVLETASRRTFPAWYGDTRRVLREELGYVYRAWIAARPSRRAHVRGRAAEAGVELERRDALRVTLAWDADANDVDLHVVDPAGEEAFYGHKTTALGLELYEDITQGFGPEVVRAEKLAPGTYHVGVNYYATGAMGVSRGVLVVLRSDPRAGAPPVQILPFRLVEDDVSEVRRLATIEVKAR